MLLQDIELAKASMEDQKQRVQMLVDGAVQVDEQATEVLHKARIVEQLSISADESSVDGQQRISIAAKQIEQIMNRSEGILGHANLLTNLSQDIVKIAKVLQDITKQTNLLSLNAAIEAARAGEHGRGFGVVAKEVRILAEGSSKSLKEVNLIVNQITKEIEGLTASAKEGLQVAQIGNTEMVQSLEQFTKVREVMAALRSNNEDVHTISQEMKDLTAKIREVSVPIAANRAQISRGLDASLQLQKLIQSESHLGSGS